MIVGQKGTGKSTFFVPIAQYYIKRGYKVFCNFPMKDCYAIPVKEVIDKKSGEKIITIDKDWLFHTDLRYCVILLDEAAAIWGSRDYAVSWTSADTKWFTQLRKNHTVVWMITQYFDLIDLNCKRSCDTQLFLTRSNYFKNITFCDFSQLASAPFQDRNEVIGIKGMKGFVHEKYDLCARHERVRRFYRSPFYNDFDSDFSFEKYNPMNEDKLIAWNKEISW